MPNPLIPAVDAAAVPGPFWLFHVLLVLTFFLHLGFMNLTLGGTLLAAISQLASKGAADDPRTVLAARLMGINNYGISLTITTGVAPLLFVQVLYQQYFYPATILLGWIWFAFLVMLAVGYYAAYAYKFRGVPSVGRGGTAWLILSAVMFFLIAMVQVAVNLVHSRPDHWSVLADQPLRVLADPSFFPRLLHFVLAALAFSGVIAAWWAVRQARRSVDVELNRSIAATSWRWAMFAIMLQFVDGILFLLVLPGNVLKGLMRGGVATLAPLGISIVLALALTMLLARVRDPVEEPGTVNLTLGLVAVLMAIMSITRHQVRALYLATERALHTISSQPQWTNIVLFVVLLVAGLGLTWFMIHRVMSSPATGDNAA